MGPAKSIATPAAIKRRYRKLAGAVRNHGWKTALAAAFLQVPLLAHFWKLFLGRPLKSINIFGAEMIVDLSDPGLSWQLITRGQREVEHSNDIRANLRPGMSGIDLGANMGYFALLEAKAIGPNGRLYCIEPVSANVEILRNNIKLNGYDNAVRVFQNLVSSGSDRLKITLSAASNSHHVRPESPETDSGADQETVTAISIDEFMTLQGLIPSDINFLRCDIEGYEAVALKGMTKLLGASTPLDLFIELHPDMYPLWGTDICAITKLFSGYGFTILKAVKEFSNNEGLEPKTEILERPSFESYLARQAIWPKGGVQMHLKR